MISQRKQIRLTQYDYSQPGYYYITICTNNRSCIFGNVINGKMILNDVGKIINNVWFTIPNHFNNVKLDSFQIMPNHIHAIIIIVGAGSSRPMLGKIIGYYKYQCTKNINNIWIRFNNSNNGGAKTAPLHNVRFNKIFQRNYYEHIIRNEIELYKIRRYIKSNPSYWKNDINHHYV